MNVYKLEVVKALLSPASADAVGYSEWSQARGMVILAASEAEARSLASSDGYHGGKWWLDQQLTSCDVVDLGGPARVVLRNEPTG